MSARLQRGVVIVPSALTLGNLFFGIWAIVSASRGNFIMAAWLIVTAAAADMIDGRVARVTQTGSRFGGELDSLVDGISFGVAPALVIYHQTLTQSDWGWILAFFYIAAAVVRLARFNIEQAGEAKVAFHGLPSPTAGMTLATFYPFSQTRFFADHLAGLPWHTWIPALMLGLAGLMMSHVLYPVVPKFGFRTARGIITLLLLVVTLVAAFTIPALYFFPMCILYIAYGVGKSLLLGFFERLPDRDLLLDEEFPDEADAELRELEYENFLPPARVWRPRRRGGRRRPRGHRPENDEERY